MNVLKRPGMTGATVNVTLVRPHGGDMLYVEATIDGKPVREYFPTDEIMRIPEGERRRVLASRLLGAHRGAPDSLSALLGKEGNVW